MKRLKDVAVLVNMKKPYPNKDGFIEFAAMTEREFINRIERKKFHQKKSGKRG